MNSWGAGIPPYAEPCFDPSTSCPPGTKYLERPHLACLVAWVPLVRLGLFCVASAYVRTLIEAGMVKDIKQSSPDLIPPPRLHLALPAQSCRGGRLSCRRGWGLLDVPEGTLPRQVATLQLSAILCAELWSRQYIFGNNHDANIPYTA